METTCDHQPPMFGCESCIEKRGSVAHVPFTAEDAVERAFLKARHPSAGTGVHRAQVFLDELSRQGFRVARA